MTVSIASITLVLFSLGIVGFLEVFITMVPSSLGTAVRNPVFLIVCG